MQACQVWAHACNPSSGEAEVRKSEVEGQPTKTFQQQKQTNLVISSQEGTNESKCQWAILV